MIKALSCNFLSIVLKTTTALKSRQLLRTFYKVFSHGTVGTLKMIPATYPASALTVPITAISIPLRKGLPTVTRALYTPTVNKVRAAMMIESPILKFTFQKKNGKRGMREPISAEKPTRRTERIAFDLSGGVS